MPRQTARRITPNASADSQSSSSSRSILPIVSASPTSTVNHDDFIVGNRGSDDLSKLVQGLSTFHSGLEEYASASLDTKRKEDLSAGFQYAAKEGIKSYADYKLHLDKTPGASKAFRAGMVQLVAQNSGVADSLESKLLLQQFNADRLLNGETLDVKANGFKTQLQGDPEAAFRKLMDDWKVQKVGGLDDPQFASEYIPHLMQAEKQAWEWFYKDQVDRLDEKRREQGYVKIDNFFKLSKANKVYPTRSDVDRLRDEVMTMTNLPRDQVNSYIVDAVGKMTHEGPQDWQKWFDVLKEKDASGISFMDVTQKDFLSGSPLNARIAQLMDHAESRYVHNVKEAEHKQEKLEKDLRKSVETKLSSVLMSGGDIGPLLKDPRIQQAIGGDNVMQWYNFNKTKNDPDNFIPDHKTFLSALTQAATGDFSYKQVQDLYASKKITSTMASSLMGQVTSGLERKENKAKESEQNKAFVGTKLNPFENAHKFINSQYDVSVNADAILFGSTKEAQGKAVDKFENDMSEFLQNVWLPKKRTLDWSDPDLRKEVQRIRDEAIKAFPNPKLTLGASPPVQSPAPSQPESPDVKRKRISSMKPDDIRSLYKDRESFERDRQAGVFTGLKMNIGPKEYDMETALKYYLYTSK